MAKAEKLMKKSASGARRTVLAFEAFLNLPPGKTDAIFLHACCFQPPKNPAPTPKKRCADDLQRQLTARRREGTEERHRPEPRPAEE